MDIASNLQMLQAAIRFPEHVNLYACIYFCQKNIWKYKGYKLHA